MDYKDISFVAKFTFFVKIECDKIFCQNYQPREKEKPVTLHNSSQ